MRRSACSEEKREKKRAKKYKKEKKKEKMSGKERKKGGGEGEEGTWGAEAPKELVVAVQLRGARGLAKADTFGKSDP